jgi:integrase
MASIDKRGKGYRVRWRDPDSGPRSRQCPDHRTAKRLQREIERAVAEGRRWEPDCTPAVVGLEEILKAFITDSHRHNRPTTVDRYAYTLEMFRRWLKGQVGARRAQKPSVLTQKLLGDWYDALGSGKWEGRERAAATCRKAIEVVQIAWRWAYGQDEFDGLVPQPKTIRFPVVTSDPTVAPTWAEMDTVIAVANDGQRRLAMLLRFTGLRVQQAMGLRWDDIDIRGSTLTVRGELGKTKQERRGRVVPLSPFLLNELRTWERDSDWIVPSRRKQDGPRARKARARDMARLWKRAGIREEVWKRRPHHCFRKGFVTGLKDLRADNDAVEVLVGHSLGLRGVYTDNSAHHLRETIKLIPPIQSKAQVIDLDARRAG